MQKLATLSLSLLLAACGGGGEGTSSAADPAATASAATATQLGLVPVAGAAAGEVGYDMAATMGDSWRIYIHEGNKTFRLVVLDTAYGVTGFTGSYTLNNGALVYTGSGADAGKSFTLKLNTSLKSIVGQVKPTNALAATSVTGSGYSVPASFSTAAQTALDGDYAFGGRLNVNGTQQSTVGTVRISGTSVKVCRDGWINQAGTGCDSPSPSFVTPVFEQLTVASVAATGVSGNVWKLSQNGQHFGIIHLKASDRGPALLIDINDQARTTKGALLAAKLKALSGNELDGTWTSPFGETATVSGTTVTVKSASGTTLGAHTLAYNKGLINNAIAAKDGVVTDATNGSMHVVPVSSSMAAMEEGGNFYILTK